MLKPSSIGTILLVTGVTFLIWMMAAGYTREQSTVAPRVQFQVKGQGRWKVEPPFWPANITIEGSRMAIDNAERQLRPLMVEVPARVGRQQIDLKESLSNLEAVRNSGVTILSVDPRSVELEVDEIRPRPATVRPRLPSGYQFEEVEVEPATATVWLPGRLQSENPIVEAALDPAMVEGLDPGVRHSITVPLRLSRAAFLGALEDVEVDPRTVKLSFTIRSRILQTTRDDVRVHLAGPHEDFLEYDIQLEPAVLRGVTIRAEANLIERIDSREATLVAVVHLSNREKEQRIKSKPVGYYLVLLEGWSRGRTVEAVGERPVINFTITRRPGPGMDGLRD